MKMLDLLAGEGVAVQLEQGTTIRYAELRARIHARASKWLETFSIEYANHRSVVILEQTPFEQIISIFAGFHLGMIVNIGGEPTSLHARWVCVDGEIRSVGTQSRSYGKAVDALFVTSGTTQSERIVGHRQESLFICAREMAEVLELGVSSRVALTLDLSFHYGFSVMTATFFANGTLLLPDQVPGTPGFVFRFNEWFQTSRPNVLAAVPQGWALFSRMIDDDIWTGVITMVSAGDLLSKELVQHMSDLHPSAKIHVFYGSTEVLRTCHRLWQSSDEEGCIGKPFPFANLSIIDGVVYQSGETLFEEVWEGDKCICRAESWRLQDTLRVDKSGNWYFLHRSIDVLKVSGKRISPILIERYLTSVEEIDDAIVVEYEQSILGILCVPVHQNLTTIEVVIPKVYQPKQWIVLHKAFPLTPRNKRSRQWITHYALRHTDPVATPPFRLVAR